MKIWKAVVFWLQNHLGQIMGGFLVGLAVKVSLNIVHKPTSLLEGAILITISAIAASYAGIVLDYLITLKRISLRPAIQIYEGQVASDMDLLSFIRSERPRKAKLLEYSSATIHTIISNLIKANADIRLLLQHPDFATSEEQRGRIWQQVKAYSMEFPEYPHLRIRFYKNRATLRGHKFDDRLLCLSWYRYEVTKSCEKVWGHNNPIISVSNDDKSFNQLNSWFEKIFDKLWNSGVPLLTMYENCPDLKKLGIPKEWIELVSK